MADVFISYSSEERDTAAQLAAALESKGYSVWWDRNLEGGADFSDDIEREMHAAGAIVVAWSEAAGKSHWVRDEASYGRDAKKLVPITLDGAQPPIGFRQVQTIDFTGWSGSDDECVARLASAVGRCCGREDVAAPVAEPKPASTKVATIMAIVGAIFMLAVAGWWFSRDGDDVAAEAELQQTGVAVLPFRSLSGDDDDRYFAEGLTEEILNRLGALPELRVTSRSAAFQFADSDLPLNEIADQLEVSHLVEGSVRRSGENWRVSAQLIRASDNSQLWSDSYDATGDDIINVQSEIAERAAEALGVLLDDGKLEIMASVGINNPEAYAAWARGAELFTRAHEQGATFESLEAANVAFDRAFALEPRLWSAQHAAVDRYGHLITDHSIGFPVPDEMAAMAKDEISRRLALARQTAPRGAYPILDQQALLYSDNWTGAEVIIRQMLAERTTCPTSSSYDEWLVVRLGLVDEYIDYANYVLACDPTYEPAQLVNMLVYAGRADEAVAVAEGVENPTQGMLRAKVFALVGADRIEDAKAVRDAMDQQTYYHGQATTFIAGIEGDVDTLNGQLERFDAMGAPDAAYLQVAAVMGNQDLVDEVAARMDARPGGASWFGSSLDVTCHCGDPFDLDATPNYKARLAEAGITTRLKSPIDWPLVND